MKKRMTVIAAMIIGFGCWPSGAVVMAEKADDKNTDCLLEDYLAKNSLEVKEDDILSDSENLLGIGEDCLFEQPRNMFGVEEKETVEEDMDAESTKEDEERDSEELGRGKESAGDESVASGMKNLQIPQKLGIVIDPWEMDGRGQIYSEKYVIQNEGDTAGTLTLSNLACKSQESGKVIVRPDKNGLHDDDAKTLYMEMWFGDSDHIVLSEQETEYQVKLEPNEELTIYFAGEVNEYASENWRNDDVRVSVVYSWDIEEVLIDENVDGQNSFEPEGNEIKETLKNTSVDDEEKMNDDTVKTEDLNERKENQEKFRDEVINRDDSFRKGDIEFSEENIFYIDGDVQTSDGDTQEVTKENSTKVIELSEGQETKAVIDFWKVEPDQQITSAEYFIRNVGERTGIFSLIDLVCQSGEERGIDIKTTREEVQDVNEKAIYMEMILGNGDKVVLSPTGSEYRVGLKPGEELAVQFVGITNVGSSESWEKYSVVVNAVVSWDVEE